MKINQPTTQIEQQFDSSMNILSTTDLKGAITYVNDDFISISGFEQDELIGRNHNMVRHPDMPPAAFQMLWDTVKSGQSWMGVVKNRCKNGNHYWVDAYVTPIEKNGAVSEYQSVRRKPNTEFVKRAEKIYPDLLAGKMPRALKKGLSFTTRVLLTALIPTALTAFVIVGFNFSSQVTAMSLLGALAVSGLLLWQVFIPFRNLVKQAHQKSQDQVAQHIYTGRNDDIGQLMLLIKMLESETAGLVGRIADSANSLSDSSSMLSSAVTQSESGVRHQVNETEQVATAVNEMSASVQEVAQNAQSSSNAAVNGLQEVTSGKQIVDEGMCAIQELKKEIEQATLVIAEVNENSKNISGILDVIGGVAEQTNLLALNAAIEAARAGEAGRGFAVVADEVRSLANRTQSSTSEIRQMIDSLQSNASKAVEVMEVGQRKTDVCVEQNAQTVTTLDTIYTAIELIADMNTQIAAAVEQQSSVAEEINKSVYSIRDMSEQNLSSVELSAQISTEMLSISTGFSELSKQFWAKQNG